MADWTNSDGLEVRFKNPEAGQTGASVSTMGAIKTLVVDIADLKTAITPAADGSEAFIPAGSQIINAFFKVTSAVTGTSATLTVGLAQKDGTAISATAIMTATEGTQANMAAGKTIVCNGGYLATSASSTQNATYPAYIYTVVGGTMTGGAGKLVVNYI